MKYYLLRPIIVSLIKVKRFRKDLLAFEIIFPSFIGRELSKLIFYLGYSIPKSSGTHRNARKEAISR